MKGIKWENIFLIILCPCYIANAIGMNNAIETLLIQLSILFIARLGIKYLRLNSKQVKEEIKSILSE